MIEGILEINSYEMDDVQSGINKTNTEIGTTNDEAKQDFVSFKQSGVFGKGIKKINSQMDSITNSLMEMNSTIQKGTEEIFEVEYKLAEEAKSIEIPTGFGVDNNLNNQNFSSISLKKEDGKSVNNGNASNVADYDSNSEITSKEELYQLNQNPPEKQEFDDSNLYLNKIKLADLSNYTSEIAEEPVYNESEKIELDNINKETKSDVRQEVTPGDDMQKINIQNVDNEINDNMINENNESEKIQKTSIHDVNNQIHEGLNPEEMISENRQTVNDQEINNSLENKQITNLQGLSNTVKNDENNNESVGEEYEDKS